MALQLNLNKTNSPFSNIQLSPPESAILSVLERLNTVQKVEEVDRHYVLCKIIEANRVVLSPEIFKTVVVAFKGWGHGHWLFVALLRSGKDQLALQLMDMINIPLTQEDLTIALWSGCLHVAKQMLKEGMVINKQVLEKVDTLNPQVVFPLKCLEIFQLLMTQRVNFQMIGPKFLSKLVLLGDEYIETMRFLLVDRRVAPDAKEEGRNTPLVEACMMDNPPKEMIRLLVDKGANPYAKGVKSDYPLVRLLVRGQKINLLQIVLNETEEGVHNFVKHFHAQFKVGHVNSFGASDTGHYRGSRPLAMQKVIVDGLKTLPPSIARQIAHPHKGQIIRGFARNKFNAKDLVKSIQEGDLVLLVGGYPDHTNYVIFYRGYMVVCDRSYEKTIEAFKIDSKKFTDMVHRLYVRCNNKQETRERAQKFYHTFLPGLLSALSEQKIEKDEVCHQLEESLSAKQQKIGNCSFASAKLAVRAALALLRIRWKSKKRATLNKDEALQARHISKAISTHIRLRALDSYCQLKEEGNGFFSEAFAQEGLQAALKHLEKTPEIALEDYPLVHKLVNVS